jgi:hypothetical protein
MDRLAVAPSALGSSAIDSPHEVYFIKNKNKNKIKITKIKILFPYLPLLLIFFFSRKEAQDMMVEFREGTNCSPQTVRIYFCQKKKKKKKK